MLTLSFVMLELELAAIVIMMLDVIAAIIITVVKFVRFIVDVVI